MFWLLNNTVHSSLWPRAQEIWFINTGPWETGAHLFGIAKMKTNRLYSTFDTLTTVTMCTEIFGSLRLCCLRACPTDSLLSRYFKTKSTDFFSRQVSRTILIGMSWLLLCTHFSSENQSIYDINVKIIAAKALIYSFCFCGWLFESGFDMAGSSQRCSPKKGSMCTRQFWHLQCLL